MSIGMMPLGASDFGIARAQVIDSARAAVDASLGLF